MRQLVIDTETTGLNARSGDRILEFGAVEIVNRRLTGNNLHFYINPERDSEPGALAVHGITTDFLADKPKFAEVAATLRDYLADAELIIHNAAFDIGFLDAEFARLGQGPMATHCALVTDTLAMAKSLYPGKRNSLDALCERLGVSNAHRTLHGALLDAELLAEVYLAMTRGQETLMIDDASSDSRAGAATLLADSVMFGELVLPVIVATEDELAAHEQVLQSLDKTRKAPCVWHSTAAVATEEDALA